IELMVEQYPHILKVKSLDTGQYEEFSICRDVPNSGADTIQGQDNVAYVFTSMVYAPKGVEKLLIGQDIKVRGEYGEIRLKGKVMRSTQDHFHTRIWI